jgi:multiple sugar transport system permease protein
MSFIAPTERKHWKTRALIAGMYAVVITGALTMVYPFLLMLSGSLKDRLDFERFEVVPSYFTDDALLYRKFLRARYNANIWRWQMAARSDIESFADIPYPSPRDDLFALEFVEFLASDALPAEYLTLGQTGEAGVQPRIQRQFRHALSKRFGGSLAALNRAFGTTFKSWDEIHVPEPELLGRGKRVRGGALQEFHFREFRPRIPRHEFWPIHTEGHFFTTIRAQFGRDIGNLNAKLATNFRQFQDVPLPRTWPAGEPYAPLWEHYVRREINEAFLRLRASAQPGYRAFLRDRHGPIEKLNAAYGTAYASFDDVTLPAKCPSADAPARDWLAFIETGDCLPLIEIDSVEFRFRDWLKQKRGGDAGQYETMPLDLASYDAHLLAQHRGEVLWEFATRNYRHAWDFLALCGRAFWNTAIYCGGNVLLHLIVNPLAAYALSRHRLRWSHLILLFCMLTMAIPGEVGSIPRFLLIRELGLLNTFWALILPGAAHGFSIFILKGFFDGLPQDLYEAAQIEGAPERWMFWNVTLALTRPILAVTALGAFTSAYGAFLFALIICPDERMWTISVWLYQFRQQTSEAVGFAALVLASIPVLVVFLFAQRVILRGIVLPVEK